MDNRTEKVMKNPIVSIIVPVYNVKPYLEQCIDSILSQTSELRYAEVILVDDCSSDGSGEIAEKYGRMCDRVKIIHHQSNQGLSIARNSGIIAANGDWLWFVDSDDWIDKGSLNVLFDLIGENKSCDVICVQKRHIRQERSYVKNEIPSPLIMSGRQYLKSDLQKTCAQKFIVKRDFLINQKLFFYPHILHEDILYCNILLYYAEKVYVSEKPLYQRRLGRPGSITGSIGVKNAYDMIIIHKQLMGFWESVVEVEDKEWYFKLCWGALCYAYKMADAFYGTIEYSDFYAKNRAYKNDVCKMALQYGDIRYKINSFRFRLSPHYMWKLSQIKASIKRRCGL